LINAPRLPSRFVFGILGCALAATLLLPARGASPNESTSEKIERQIAEIRRTDLDDGMRAYVAEKMAEDVMMLWEGKRTGEINRQAIFAIAELLDDDSDAVREEAAASLGMIGPRARNAVPALHRALKRIQEENRRPTPGGEITVLGPDSESAIRIALRRIARIPDDLDEQARMP
jgi:hypothetical protein